MSSVRKKVSVVNLLCDVDRKDRRLPRFMVVPARLLDAWKLDGTAIVEATVNGVEVGRRSLKKWNDDRWFVELPQPLCDRAEVDTGDRVNLSLRLASEKLPEELATLLANSRPAQAAWAKLTPAQQRMLSEEVLAAKSADTRRRRAGRRLGVLRQGY
ncbi:MAG: YdeI/OmpD-associated family protein [Planctomycetota bacterium]